MAESDLDVRMSVWCHPDLMLFWAGSGMNVTSIWRVPVRLVTIPPSPVLSHGRRACGDLGAGGAPGWAR